MAVLTPFIGLAGWGGYVLGAFCRELWYPYILSNEPTHTYAIVYGHACIHASIHTCTHKDRQTDRQTYIHFSGHTGLITSPAVVEWCFLHLLCVDETLYEQKQRGILNSSTVPNVYLFRACLVLPVLVNALPCVVRSRTHAYRVWWACSALYVQVISIL